MATEFFITSRNNPRKFSDVSFKDAATQYSFDLTQWSEENGDITSATWEVVDGQCTVSGASETSNVCTALVSFGEPGGNLIKVVATTGSEIYVAYLDVLVCDPTTANSDYGSTI